MIIIAYVNAYVNSFFLPRLLITRNTHTQKRLCPSQTPVASHPAEAAAGPACHRTSFPTPAFLPAITRFFPIPAFYSPSGPGRPTDAPPCQTGNHGRDSHSSPHPDSIPTGIPYGDSWESPFPFPKAEGALTGPLPCGLHAQPVPPPPWP